MLINLFDFIKVSFNYYFNKKNIYTVKIIE